LFLQQIIAPKNSIIQSLSYYDITSCNTSILSYLTIFLGNYHLKKI